MSTKATFLFLFLLLTHSLGESIDEKNQGLGQCAINHDIYITCDNQRWSESTDNGYNKCVEKHNGFLNDYNKPPTPDDCSGGKACLYCEVENLTECVCYCYDDCDGAYVTGMRILSAFLTVVVFCICLIWTLNRNKGTKPPKTKEERDKLIDTNVTIKIDNEIIRFGKIIEIKDDKNNTDDKGNFDILYKIKFSDESKSDEWLKSNQLTFHGNKNEEKEETTWKFYVGCLICLLCTIFAIILYYNPMAFYPNNNTVSQEEKMKDWGIGFIVFGCIGTLIFLLCICLTLIQRKLDREEIEKKNTIGKIENDEDIEMKQVTTETDKNQSETQNEIRTKVTVQMWIMRTIGMGICCIALLILGSLMVGSPDSFQ